MTKPQQVYSASSNIDIGTHLSYRIATLYEYSWNGNNSCSQFVDFSDDFKQNGHNDQTVNIEMTELCPFGVNYLGYACKVNIGTTTGR